jgi:hypothetical protein
MEKKMSITNNQIEALRNEAATAGDLDMVAVCTAALADGNIEICTAKGSFTGSVREVCAWQAEMQGAAATIGQLNVDAIDFDADEMRATTSALRNAARAECERVITDAQAAE